MQRIKLEIEKIKLKWKINLFRFVTLLHPTQKAEDWKINIRKSKKGSSNLYRHFGAREGFSMVNCTTMEMFKVPMASLEEEEERVVISVIEIIIGVRGSENQSR